MSADFRAAFASAAGATGRMSFAQFMQLALYHPAVGYYQRPRARVGRSPGTDFYTASSSAPLFGELVAAAAAAQLRQRGEDPAAYTFLEIGSEDDAGILAGVDHPFACRRTTRLGQQLKPADRCIVFSNELFDAQPCARYVRVDDGWAEVMVQLDREALRDVLHPLDSPPRFLPPNAPVGYRFDAPLAAAELAGQLAEGSWRGLFLAFDYGKSWEVLAHDTPAGTARGYFQHQQTHDLLDRPSEQDLTCHVCWDWIRDALAARDFAVDAPVAQESYFVRYAGEALSRLIAAEGAGFSPRKMSLLQLLHPAHLGQKFQVLSAWRG